MVYISDVFSTVPTDERCSLEMKSYQVLTSLGIEFSRVDNDVVESMLECSQINEKLGCEIRKSVLVCNRKKTEFHLVILPADKSFDTKVFCEKVGCSRVSFASADTMNDILGVNPGCLTIMSVLNDSDNLVKVVIDKEVAKEQWFACNIGTNTTHIKIKTQDLLDKLLPNANHLPLVLDL